MKNLLLILFTSLSLCSFSQESRLYLSTSLDFIAHENGTGCVATINRAFEEDAVFNTNLEIFYTISGSGVNEASITSGSAIIPIGKAYVDIPINPTNNPNSVSADRNLTITITPNPNYTISNDFGYNKGVVTIDVKDKLPLKAFPSAYGGGAYAKGGRGGNVYHVTKLNDDGSEGTYRWALAQSRPATIVFDVSGTIVLNASLNITCNDLTIAGQTAPGGITVTTDGASDYDVGARGDCDDFIMRYVKFRYPITTKGGFATYSNGKSSRNMIFDHLSFSWAGNSSFGTRGNLTQNITLQRSILAESKVGALMTNSQNHEWTTNVSTHNNLWYNTSHRTPNNGANGRVDNINNVVQYWKFRLSYINGDNRYNHLNNYYAMGGRTEIENYWGQLFINFLDTSYGAKTTATTEDTLFDYEVYTSGNIVDKGIHGLTDDNRALWGEFDSEYKTYVTTDINSPTYPFVDTQHELIGDSQSKLPIQTATDFYNELITSPDIGANATLNADGSVNFGNDVVDSEYLAVMAQGEGAFEEYTTSATASNRSHYYTQRHLNFLASISTTPINTRPDNFYNPEKSLHIPEAFYDLYMPADATHNDIAPSGYTWLEEYLNGVDSDSEIVAIGVESIAVTPATGELQLTETLQLTATFTPSNATNQNGEWTTSDETIATVDTNGLVTPVSPGQVIITFTTSDGGFTDTSEITVFPEALEPSAGDDQQICEGESVTLTASGGTNYVWSTGETTESIEVTPDETTVYTVTVSDDNEQSEDANVTVTVNAIPTANAGEDQSICEGNSTILTATGGTSYLWSTGETTSSIEVSPTEETIYTVEVNDNNCSSSDDVIIMVNEAPVITISEGIVIVEGESTTLTVSGSDTYEWSTGETAESITVNPLITTTYTVTSIGPNGCLSNAEVTVTVIPETIANAGEDDTICSGETVTLTALGGSNYTWSTGDLGSELIVNPTETTTYTVTVEDEYGYTDTDEVTVFVNEVPNITVSDDVFIMIGSSVTLTANGGSTYSWNTGDTTSEIIVSPDTTTTYTVTGFSENGCQSFVEVLVTVIEELNANAGEDSSICLGESITLSASGGITYTWDTGDTGASPIFTPTETTTYTVTVTDGFGNTDADDVIITVNPSPTADAGEDQSICLGESVILTAQGGDSYIWSTGETTDTITVNPEADTVYTVEVFTNSCSDSDEVNVFVLPTPELTVSDDIILVTGNSTTLEVSGADSYLWSTSETSSSIIVSPTDTTSYNVIGYSENGCESTTEVTVTVVPQVIANAGNDISICYGVSVILTASGGANYLWNTGETSASITISPTETETYTVTVSDSFGNSDLDSVIVTVNDIPSITLSEDITIFEGETTNLIVNGAETYLWNTGDTSNTISVNPTVTTTYSVTGFSGGGCEITEDVTVTVVPELNADAGNDVAICIGESVTLTASGGTNYSWNTGETNASITFNPTVTATFTVTVSDNFGNSESDSVVVTVNELPNITLTDDITILEGESTNLSVSGAETYQWNTGETSSVITVSPTETTTYNVTGFSESGCQITEEVTVNVVPEVNANAGNDVSICNGESITLSASGGTNYTWNTGNTSASPTFTPTETTTYTVTVSDSFGNSDSDSVTVTVNELPSITVSENITIIEGESTNLSVNGAESYLWNTSDTSNTITVNPTQTTTYSVIGITNTCSSEQAEITVTVTPLFQASAGTDERVCDNESYEVVLTANQGDSYLWSTGETTQSIVVSPLSTETYTVTVTLGEQSDTDNVMVYVDPSPEVAIANGDSVEILSGDFVTLSASGANTYQWNNGGTQPNIAVSPSTTTTYEVKGFIGQCFDNKQVTVNVLQPVVADAGEDVLICLAELTTLTASGGDDYVWSTGETTPTITVSPIETTDYTVTVFNALDFDEATVRVEVDLDCAVDTSNPNEEETEFSFDIYPNPASDIVNVKLSGALNVSDINIYDVTGKLIKHSKITNENLSYSTTTQINVSTLQSGVYFVKLIDEDRAITKKLIIE